MDAMQPLAGERCEGESKKAITACNDWLRMGPGRSIPALIEKYRVLSSENPQFHPPSLKKGTLATWSYKFEWQNRASIYDAEWEARQNEERERVFKQGLALDFERVKKLNRLADMLEAQIYEIAEYGEHAGEQHRLWLPDAKWIGAGDTGERVDIVRFNSGLLSEFRNTLNDIAAEVGGRIKKSELSGPNGGAIPVEHKLPDLPDDTLADIFGKDVTHHNDAASDVVNDAASDDPDAPTTN